MILTVRMSAERIIVYWDIYRVYYEKSLVLNVYLGPWPDLPAFKAKSPIKMLPTG
jgi:hypothetical protein